MWFYGSYRFYFAAAVVASKGRLPKSAHVAEVFAVSKTKRIIVCARGNSRADSDVNSPNHPRGHHRNDGQGVGLNRLQKGRVAPSN